MKILRALLFLMGVNLCMVDLLFIFFKVILNFDIQK